MKETLWEEENLTDRNQNSTTNVENVNENTTTETLNDSIKFDQKDITINSGIYKIVNKINGKYYVGSSKFFENRWKKHRKMLRRNVHENPHLQSAWNKYGKDVFEFMKIEFVKVEVLLEIEQKYLDIANTEQDKCYNMNFVASLPPSWKGRKRSPETIQRMRDCKMGDKNPMFGKKHSEEHKRKISEKIKNNPNCAWNRGLKMSEEYRKTLSSAIKKSWKRRKLNSPPLPSEPCSSI